MTNLSLGQIKQLAKLEQQMDSGETPYVCLGSNRLTMKPEAMTQFGLKTGQTISDVIFREILNFNIAQCRIQLDVEDARNETE